MFRPKRPPFASLRQDGQLYHAPPRLAGCALLRFSARGHFDARLAIGRDLPPPHAITPALE